MSVEEQQSNSETKKSGPGGRRAGAGRKKHPIDIKQLESLCAAQCTDEEIAAHVGVTRRAWAEIKKRPAIADAIRNGRAKGIGSLRSAQFKAALSGNATMLIWMGKQLLGQRDDRYGDKQGDDTDAKPLVIEIVDTDAKLSR